MKSLFSSTLEAELVLKKQTDTSRLGSFTTSATDLVAAGRANQQRKSKNNRIKRWMAAMRLFFDDTTFGASSNQFGNPMFKTTAPYT